MGGWGVHSEVMANLLYGLILYDPVRYQEAMLPAVRYLESVQNDGKLSHLQPEPLEKGC
jgi:hypothetical protein